MTDWQGLHLHDIAEELKNIREILEKRSTIEVMEYPQVEGITPTLVTTENVIESELMEEMQTQVIEFPDTHQKFVFARKIEMDGDCVKICGWEYKGVKTEKGAEE